MQQQRVGPFIFFDHMGPALFEAGTTEGDVRPHPHIGLATVTYLFSGAMMHRDSMGVVQRIEPGAINLMSAGRGVVHSERIPADIRETRTAVQGVQTWLALPEAMQEDTPYFVHTAAADLPVWRENGIEIKVLIGHIFGCLSPVRTPSPTTYLDIRVPAGSHLDIPARNEELAVYAVEGDGAVNDGALPANHVLVLDTNAPFRLTAGASAIRILLFGGAGLPGVRYLNWNFVATSKERIEAARDAWKNDQLGSVPGETERIPLP